MQWNLSPLCQSRVTFMNGHLAADLILTLIQPPRELRQTTGVVVCQIRAAAVVVRKETVFWRPDLI
jgi:hypothetical protein